MSRPAGCPSRPICTAAVAAADAVFIAVGTPSRRGDGHADLSYVYAAAHEIAAALNGFTVVVTKSTVPVGTGDEVERIIREASPDADFAVVSNPEFLREGAAIEDFKHPDRIVIGTDDRARREVMSELYRPLYLNRAPILFTEPAHRRADQICRQRLSRDEDHLHQRDRRPVREGRRRRAGRGARHRARQPHRREVPACRPGLWRLLLPQGHAGADQDRRRTTSAPLRIVETVVAVNDTRKRAMARKVHRALGGTCAARPSPCSA